MKKSDLTKLIAIGAAVTAAAATTAIVISKHKKHKTMLAEHTKTLTKKQAYITGGGLSAFASALYLVRDCGFTPENIHIFTNGTRDCGNNETGFICHRGKTISIKDSMNFFDLISDVDSLDIPDLTVCDEILNIYRANIYPRSVTLIDQDKNVIDSSKSRFQNHTETQYLHLCSQNVRKFSLRRYLTLWTAVSSFHRSGNLFPHYTVLPKNQVHMNL